MMFRELETFVTLQREGSFSKAARVLGVPRSTISRRLSRLEEMLDETLVERTTRMMKLTDAGQILFRRIQPILEEIHSITDEISQLHEEPQGTLRISTPPGLGRDFMVRFLKTLRKQYPKIHIDFFVSSKQSQLFNEQFDIIIQEEFSGNTGWIAHTLGPANHFLVASPDYLKKFGVPENIDALQKHNCISLVEEGFHGNQWPLLTGAVCKIHPVFQSNDLDVVRQATLAGIGLALLPFSITSLDVTHGYLVPVLSKKVGRNAKLVAFYPSSRRHSPKIKAFFHTLDQFISSIAEELPIRNLQDIL